LVGGDCCWRGGILQSCAGGMGMHGEAIHFTLQDNPKLRN
jgi:hypothetical protein